MCIRDSPRPPHTHTYKHTFSMPYSTCSDPTVNGVKPGSGSPLLHCRVISRPCQLGHWASEPRHENNLLSSHCWTGAENSKGAYPSSPPPPPPPPFLSGFQFLCLTFFINLFSFFSTCLGLCLLNVDPARAVKSVLPPTALNLLPSAVKSSFP